MQHEAHDFDEKHEHQWLQGLTCKKMSNMKFTALMINTNNNTKDLFA
jgi:hypothetical protein